MEALQYAMRAEFPDRRIEFHLLDSDDKSESIHHFAEDHQIDMVVFIAHKISWFKNLFRNQIHKRDFFRLELPMLALHEVETGKE
jgi:hypothetical protein